MGRARPEEQLAWRTAFAEDLEPRGVRRLAGPQLTPEFLGSLRALGWDGDVHEMRAGMGLEPS